MLVQHYRMQMPDNMRRRISPGQAVFNADDSEVIGFIWKHDPIDNVVDVVLFKPENLPIEPHQTFVAAAFPEAEKIFAAILAEATSGVQNWWRGA